MLKLIRSATFGILLATPLAFYACGGDEPTKPDDDTTKPKVTSVTPANGSDFVSVGADISVTFSEAMDQSTMINSTLAFEPAVTGMASYSDKVLTFEADSLLRGDTIYTVTVTTAAKDKAGNPLASAFDWQFSTDLDNTPPTVLSTTPADGAVDFAVGRAISVRFSEEMEPATMAASFQISPSAAGSVVYADSILTFVPSVFFTGGQNYEVTVTTTATDTAGNALPSAYVWQFTTLDDTNPPTGTIASPVTDAVVGNSTTVTVSASDQTGVDRVVFYIDSVEQIGSDDFNPPYQYDWDATGLDTGSVHRINAEVFDVLGNSQFLEEVQVNYLWQLIITDDDEDLIHRDIHTVHGRSTGSYLEFRVETFGGWADYVSADSLGFDIAIYLDTDQNRATGDTTASDGDPAWDPPGTIGINDIGADYFILIGYHGDILQRWTGNSWSNEGVVDLLNISDSSNYFEVGVLLNRLGLPDAVDVVAFSFTLFRNPLIPGDPGQYKWDWAPNEGMGHATYILDGTYNGAPPMTGKWSANPLMRETSSLTPIGPEPFN